ncbi:hypothetical protein SAMN06296036_15210 [Pseudobacteriovorax antillogorgiicola]|uniref:Uncharacterized protein n=1 Tax=Pseudobacteriovorax antillogorgiicola TaxID=1513793 RepID=A0A1Y6CXX7_9BACT|nr:hypothetical protein EDD56_1524 [Pseudobacteriovorax antillogorgiicola]SMF84114.1 hypothetical protein SAMN06296036_15210 [Pseudobacteriovorax antillogorgiicola]
MLKTILIAMLHCVLFMACDGNASVIESFNHLRTERADKVFIPRSNL